MKKVSNALAFALGIAAAPSYAVTVFAGGKHIPPDGGIATDSATFDFNNDTVGSPRPDGFFGGSVVNRNGYTNYFSVGPSTASPTYMLKKEGDPASGLSEFSLYWRSSDSFNTISILGLGPSGVF